MSALAFQGNPYDGHTLSAHREQIARLTGYEPVEALTEKVWKKFCKCAGIEPVIGHLKSDHRMMRNYLTCLVFFCLLAADAGQTPGECVI